MNSVIFLLAKKSAQNQERKLLNEQLGMYGVVKVQKAKDKSNTLLKN